MNLAQAMLKLRFIFLFVLLVSCATSVLAQKITKETLVWEGKKRTYYFYAPASVKPNTPASLVVLLHGSNHNGLSLVEKWKQLADQEGVILVGPDSADSARWSIPGDGPAFIHDLVEALKSNHSINARRVYMFGHSGGAIFALMLSLYESQYFAATAIHAGALTSEFSALLDLPARKIPIYLQVGTEDPLFPVSVVRATRDALNSRGFSVELTEIPRHTHYYYDLAPKINQAAWQFLSQHELSDEPRYEQHLFQGQTQSSRKAVEQYNLGMKRHSARDLTGAIVAYTKAIEFDGKFAEAYNNRGVAYMSLKNYAAAVSDFSRSIELKPSDAAAYNNRGGIYLSQKKPAEAIVDFTDAIKIKDSVESRANRGIGYEQTNQEALALADYEAAIRLNPNFARAYVLRGLISLTKGQEASAQKDFDKGFQLDPGMHTEFDPIISQRRANRRMN
ncbi:MAG: tetratricopeptide repeat protein [Acidobacteriota bacterium]|nr:tetratricopeptide repeat protein [Acidobacteriota bacterium]